MSYERTCARQTDLHGIAVRRFVLPTEATQAELEAVIDLVNAEVALTGSIMTKPGLGKTPAAHKIDVMEDGTITGLF